MSDMDALFAAAEQKSERNTRIIKALDKLASLAVDADKAKFVRNGLLEHLGIEEPTMHQLREMFTSAISGPYAYKCKVCGERLQMVETKVKDHWRSHQ